LYLSTQMQKLSFILLVIALTALTLTAHAQLTVEDLVALRTQPKLDAVAFLQSKGFKVDSCWAPSEAMPDLTSMCYFHQEKMFDQKKAVSTLEVSFSKTQKNHIAYVPLQQGFGARIITYMKSLKVKEEPYDLIKEQKYGKKYRTPEGWTYDVSQSMKTPDIETIYINPSKS